MIYRCCYCGVELRPRDDVESEGNPDAISDGMCSFCDAVLEVDIWATPEQVREQSKAARLAAGL
jgi:hypothetical protein